MVHKLPDLQVTNHSTPISSTLFAGLADNNGLIIIGSFDSASCAPQALQSRYAPGCILFNKSGTSTTTNIYVNTGTTDAPTWAALSLT